MLMRYMPNDGLKIAMIIAGISVPAVIYRHGARHRERNDPGTAAWRHAGDQQCGRDLGRIDRPYVMGSVVQIAGASPAEGYGHGFFICGVVALVCGLIGMIFLRPQGEAARFAAMGGGVPAPAAVG